MTRSTTSALLATAQLGMVFIGVPAWFFMRVTSSILPLRAADLILVAALVAWSFLAKAILDRDDAVDSISMTRTSPAGYAHRLVDSSLLGAGAETSSAVTTPPQLHLIAQPRELTAHELPSLLPVAEFAQGQVGFEVAGPQSVPVLAPDEPAALSVLETQEYIVARRDTFWSIAESVLGDGRNWHELQQLNIGREVAPGVLLNANHELRIGWSILLPVQAEAEADHEASHVA